MYFWGMWSIRQFINSFRISQGQLQIEYFPLRVGEQSARLELYCAELGVFPYDLELRATPAAPEKTVRFESSLGASDTKTARFLNFSKQKTDYICKACVAA